MHTRGDDHDPRGRVREEAGEEQVHEQEVAQVVHGEGELEAVAGALRALPDLEAGVADEGAEAKGASAELRSEAADGPLSLAMRRSASAETSRLRLAMTTCQPARPSSRAHSKPIPELPPVTRTASRFEGVACIWLDVV